MTIRPSASRSARAIARDQLTQAILASAREQLAAVGPAALSVRAVARDVGMVSSAVYRYFPSRDHLLTALLVSCYNELGAAVERQEQAVSRSDLEGRWQAVADGVRNWARTHPHDYGLLYGSPVPGYAAPTETVGPATRVPRLLIQLLVDVAADGTGDGGATDARLHAGLAGVRSFAGANLPDALVVRGLAAWAGLLGAVTLELYGHLVNAVDDTDAWFAATVEEISPVRA